MQERNWKNATKNYFAKKWVNWHVWVADLTIGQVCAHYGHENCTDHLQCMQKLRFVRKFVCFWGKYPRVTPKKFKTADASAKDSQFKQFLLIFIFYYQMLHHIEDYKDFKCHKESHEVLCELYERWWCCDFFFCYCFFLLLFWVL
jgi:hypothetical protein